MKVGVVLLMAGKGSRFGSDKTRVLVNKRPVWRYSYDVFASMGEISDIVIVSSNPVSLPRKRRLGTRIVKGGEYRQESVFNGLSALAKAGVDFALIHDAARPVITPELVKRIVSCARRHKACVPVIEVASTVKQVSGNRVVKTLDRDSLRLIQTPQCFDFRPLLSAYKKALKSNRIFSDDAAIWERYVGDVYVTKGLRGNIKITYPEDLICIRPMLNKIRR